MSWELGSLLVLAVALGAGGWWYERSHPGARVLALVATLAALAALGRVAFAALPNVKPTTDIVLIAGYALGGAAGFAVGSVAALTSNLVFGQGPWTPWQMAAWGAVGVFGALLARVWGGREPGRLWLALACGVAGAGYGAVMNVFGWVTFSGDHSAAKLAAVFVTSLPFDLAHVLGNVAFALAFGPLLLRALGRFRARLDVRWEPVAAGLAALAVLGAQAAPADAAAPAGQLVRYLERAQNADGGFGPAAGRRSDDLNTGWAALGLLAADRRPRAALRWMARHPRTGDTGALERTILVYGAAGRDTSGLMRALVRRQRRDGSWAGRVNTTAFGVLALRAGGRGARDRRVRRAARWIARRQSGSGGFSFAGPRAAAGVDDTAAVVQALVAAGERRSRTVTRALGFLRRSQNPDGGFPLQPRAGSNAQSTAWAVQAFVAARRDPAKVRRRGSRAPLRYLRTLIAADGSVRYSRTSAQTPVWVTAQALTAFARAPFPLPRR